MLVQEYKEKILITLGMIIGIVAVALGRFVIGWTYAYAIGVMGVAATAVFAYQFIRYIQAQVED